ncbi:MAG: efflux RND transporter permease subunit [Bacteroidales bacterium]|nr:efflux RND transporter permease subunit [Bacteroidales bacterium]
MLDKLLGRPVSVTMVFLVLIVLGAIGIGRLPVSLIPNVDIPYITVQVSDPSMSAAELDDAVIKPLRQSLIQIGHLKDLHSESKDGTATITMTFEEGQDIDYFYIEVNEKIDRSMSSLGGISRPRVFKASATDIPAFYINMTLSEDAPPSGGRDAVLYPAGENFSRMSDFARDVITKRLEQLPEVAMVDVSGTVDNEILVIPDEDALRRLGLSVGEFSGYISSANVRLSNLTIRDGEYHYNVKFRSFAATREEISDVYFRVGDRVLQIKDVARVIEHPATRSGLTLSNGQDAVVLAVIKQNEARMSDLKKQISQQLKSFEKDYPTIRFELTRDQTELLDYSIKNLLLNIILAVVFACIVIFLFMQDLRSPLLVALTIPVSLVISFFVFYLIGMTINIISLSGLLLGVGMMVDNTIVVTDNITARWQRGDPLRTAVTEGTREVSGPMLSSVLTTCAVFIPLVFLNGLAGQLFYDQAISITVVLLVAYLVTITLIPVYYWALYKRFDSFQPNRWLSRIRLGGATKWYDRTVSWFLSNRWTVWALPLLSVLVIAAGVAWMPKSKLPPITYTDAILHVDWNDPLTLDENRTRIEALIAEAGEDCDQTTALVGVQQFVLGHSPDQALNESSLYVHCADAVTLERLRQRLTQYVATHYPAAVAEFGTAGNIFDMVFAERDAELVTRLRPTTAEGLRVESLQATLAAIRAALPDVPIDEVPLKTDILYVSDPEQMALYDVSFADLQGVLTNALNGNTIFSILQGDRSIPVVMGTDVREMEQILSTSFIKKAASSPNEEPTLIPVRALMRQGWEQDFKTRIAGNEGSYYPIAMDVRSSQVSGIMKKVREAVLREGHYDAGFSGAYFSNLEMIRQMFLVLLIAIALLFLILASQFESLVQPVIILSEILIDIAASLGVLWILGEGINLMSLIGLVVICGIVINDSILKIDTINRLVRSGWEMEAAVHEAGHRRLKAIIMTSVTTILAVLPFLSRGNMGDDLQFPMALVIIVGMVVGTLVSLFFVPAVYATFFRKRKQ